MDVDPRGHFRFMPERRPADDGGMNNTTSAVLSRMSDAELDAMIRWPSRGMDRLLTAVLSDLSRPDGPGVPEPIPAPENEVAGRFRPTVGGGDEDPERWDSLS